MSIQHLKEDIVFRENIRGFDFTFLSTWGLFSPKEIDEGTQLLIEHMEINPQDVVLDLGCGYGVIGLVAAKLASQGHIHMVDKDFVALEYAEKNAEMNFIHNTEIYLSNGFSKIDEGRTFHVIASNLPAKVGKEMISIFLHDAKKHLKPGGKLYIVTVMGLKGLIKNEFEELFGNYEKVAGGKNYVVALAIK